MGLWGRAKSLFSGRPKPPKFERMPVDPMFGKRLQGPMGRHMFSAEDLAFGAMQNIANRPPGFSEEEIAGIYNPTAEAITKGTQANLRRLNQDAAATGGYGSGGRARGRGALLQGGTEALAGHRWNTRALAAKVALDDRYRQLAAIEGYLQPRLSRWQSERGLRQADRSQLRDLAMRSYLSELGQYNQDFDWAWGQLMDIGSAATSGEGFKGFFG